MPAFGHTRGYGNSQSIGQRGAEGSLADLIRAIASLAFWPHAPRRRGVVRLAA
jgi:hypothetical protein